MDSTLLGHISRCLIFYHFLSFRAAHLSFSLFSSPLYKLKCSCEGWTFELPNQNVTPPEHILVMKDDKKTPLLSFWLLWSCGEAAKPWQAAAAEALVSHASLFVLVLSHSPLLCHLRSSLLCFFAIPSCQIPPCHVICPITAGATFVFQMHVPKLLSGPRICPRFRLYSDASLRHIADYPWETGVCLIPLYPPGDCWRPSTVPLAPWRLSNDVIGEE